MTRSFFNIACILVMAHYCRGTKSNFQCMSEFQRLYRTTSTSLNMLTNLGKNEVPSFFYRFSRKRCWGYLDYSNDKSPFPTLSLTSSITKFTGKQLHHQVYKVFDPFLLATDKILNMASIPITPPQTLIKNINFEIRKLILCINAKAKVQSSLPTVPYNATKHKADVARCLFNASVSPTPTKIELVQYKDLMEELDVALKQVNYGISSLNSG